MSEIPDLVVPGDVICQRADSVIDLMEEFAKSKDEDVRIMLYSMAQRILFTIPTPYPVVSNPANDNNIIQMPIKRSD